MDNFIRTASLELQLINNREVVKVAGILNKLKNYLRQLGDHEYSNAVDVLRSDSLMVQQIANELRKKIKELTKAIDEGDIPEYDAILEEVRSLTASLSVELNNLNRNAQKSNPRLQELSKAQVKQTENSSELPEKYNREQWDDPIKRADIFAYANKMIKIWHPNHDVPVSKYINKPLNQFRWFNDKDIHIKQGGESGARNRLIDQTAKLLVRETSISYEEAISTFQNSSTFDELAKRLTNAIYNGTILHYIPATPMKEPKNKDKNWIKERQIGEMVLTVKTAEFLIPVYEISASMTAGLIDMAAPLNGVNKLVLGYTEYFRTPAGGVPPALRKSLQNKSNDTPPILSDAPQLVSKSPDNLIIEKEENKNENTLKELQPEKPDVQKKRVRKKKSNFRLELLKSLVKNAGIDFSAVQRLSDDFWVKFVEMCNRLGAKPEDLAKVINSESGFDPRATNIQDGKIIAKGLNQLVKKTAKALGMSDSEWQNYENSSAEQQLKYVEKFFRSVGNMTGVGNKWNSSTQLYVANFAPKYVAKASNPDTILYSKTENIKEYNKNKGLDRNKKGYITAGDLAHSVQTRPLSKFILQSINKAKSKVQNLQYVDLKNKPENDNVDNLLNVLFALDVGPVEKIVRHALERKYLPMSNVLITVSSLSSSYPIRMKFAKTTSSLLKEIIDADVSIHSDGNKIELQCAAAGSQYAVASAIKSLCACVVKAVELKFGQSKIKCAVLPSTISKYAEVNL